MTRQSINWLVAVPWMLTIATILTGVWQFSVQQTQANRQPFLEKQLEVSFEAANAAAILASETDREAWEKARKTFWRLFWGPLSIVEDPAVKQAMEHLGGIVPAAPDPSAQLPMTSLRQPSYRLALALRALILKSWNVDLPALEPTRRISP